MCDAINGCEEWSEDLYKNQSGFLVLQKDEVHQQLDCVIVLKYIAENIKM